MTTSLQWMEAGLQNASWIAPAAAVVSAYAGILLIQRAATRSRLPRAALNLLAILSFAAAIGCAALTAASGFGVVVASVALAALAVFAANRPQLGAGARSVYALTLGTGFWLLADRGLPSAATYDLGALAWTLAIAVGGSAAAISILQGLRQMPLRSLLPPRALAALFLAALVMLVQARTQATAAVAAETVIPAASVLLAFSLFVVTGLLSLALRLTEAPRPADPMRPAVLCDRARFLQRGGRVLAGANRSDRAVELYRYRLVGTAAGDTGAEQRLLSNLANRLGPDDLITCGNRNEYLVLHQRGPGETPVAADSLARALEAVVLGDRSEGRLLAGRAQHRVDGTDVLGLLLAAGRSMQTPPPPAATYSMAASLQA